jgi:arabinan endo-1,5-alpha-L-arabinosidase
VKSQLRHRYSFAGSDATAIDSKSGANGTLSDPSQAMQRDGAAILVGNAVPTTVGGARGGFVTLPPAILSELEDATFEVWLTWEPAIGAAPGQRVLDFGTQRNNLGEHFLYLTPLADDGNMRAVYSLKGQSASVSIPSAKPLSRNIVHHVALVVEHTRSMLRLYVEGAEQGAIRLPGTLADLTAEKLWLGRSLSALDPGFDGRILEFRVYNVALTETQLRASLQAGPDYAFLP